MIPHYAAVPYPQMCKAAKRKKKKLHYMHGTYPYKRKRYTLSYYLKHVLWRKIKRYWKKRQAKKKKSVKPPATSLVRNSRGSDEKIDQRDFWGSKYGSQWLFAKQKQLQQQQRLHNVNHNRLIEIVDAFKTTDLKYAKRHQQVDDTRTTNSRRSRRSHAGHEDGFATNPLATNPKCPCARRQARTRKVNKDGFETDTSDWSLSTLQTQQRLYSKWPPHPPPGAKHCCGREDQLATILARQHAYVYNWLYVDNLQHRCKLSLSREYLDQVRTRVARLKSANRRRCRNSYVSSRCSDGSDWTSTLSRRERAKMIKRQVRAKEKSSVLWLLSKAFEGDIPSDLLEPFYRDHENIRRLKPKIVHSLANAELYCLALVNIYADPNYHNLDHQGIVQVLMRKGIQLIESREAPLTETTLVQTAPIRMGAHMAVIDGIMSLYIKEVLIPEKIVEVVKKFSYVDINSEMPSNAEEAAVLWINKCCKALEQEIRTDCTAEEMSKLPKIPVLQEISDISDGCCIAAVISYYCPSYFKWQDVCWNNPISLGDSIYNLQLVKKFCSECLPREINFFTLEDLLYLHPSIKENVLVFVADLLYMFVIYRAACVTQRKKSVVHESSHIPLESSKSLGSFQSHKTPALCSPIPNLRSESYGGSTTSLPDIRPGSRAKMSGSKEKLCEKVLMKKSNFSSEDMAANELQRTSSVGMVNGWKTTTLPHVSSTDSVGSCTRNISTEMPRLPAEGESASSHQSQPSICSADDTGLPKNLIHPSRTSLCSQGSPQRESINFGLRKFSESNLHGLRSAADGHILNGVHEQRRGRKNLEEYYNQLAGMDGPMRSISASNIIEGNRRKCSSNSHGADSVPESSSSQSSGICLSDIDIKNTFSTTSFAQLSKVRDSSSNSINIVYMPHERELMEKERMASKVSNTGVKKVESEGKKTTFAALPNTTTWQQQHAVHSNFPQTDSGHETPTEPVDNVLNAQLCNIKMKLEDKKRKIELKKKRMEMLWKKQRQKLGKAAFLQAVSKGSSNEAGTPDSGTGKEVAEAEIVVRETALPACNSPSMVKRMSIQEIAADLDNVQKKWLNQDISDQILLQDDAVEPSVDVDNETMNIDLQTSIEHLNTSLTDLQLDISRISLQQEQVENLMKDSIDDCSHFFLHDPSVGDKGLESLSRPAMNWRFDESAMTVKQSLSSPHVDGHNMLPKQQSGYDSPFTSLPQTFSPVKAIPKEELYSKVMKPDKFQRQAATKTTAASFSRQNPSTETLAAISNADPRKRPVKSKAATEIHVILPQVPDNKVNDFSSDKKINDDKQGFYVPLEKESRKPKVRQQKNHKMGADLVHPDPNAETEMARKKEMIMNLSIQRKAEYERKRAQKEKEYAKIKEEEQRKQEELERKREEEKRRREMILEQYRQRKLQEELEKEGALLPKETIGRFTSKSRSRKETKPRPKSAYVHMNSDLSSLLAMDNHAANKRNSQILTGRDAHEFDLDSLNSASTSASSHDRNRSPNNCFPSHRNANLQIPEGSGPSSDGASDTASNGSSAAAGDYTGPKLFVKPAAKSNRGIIINAINTVLAGAVNEDTKKKVLEEINRSESKHFLILFRDAGCQFRALYTYNPDREEVTKLYGIGPKNVVDKMMDRFYKYNSGGKCFSEIQTKHLTVTIDAFTIPNSLWAGKKLIPPKKEFF
ncbi:patronin [Trichonephila clavata]|uniref:Patronin n=1 Tax=Trichonephila clavata TaxID=2740835 RepID=A0A8X6F1Q1_TRICU|nr:patronin [Trichonephila clavata]